MVYFILLLYLLILAFLYDLSGRRRYKYTNFYIALILMVLISGLRYRLGRDTPIYMDYFEDYPDIFHLTSDDFTEDRMQPLWIIVNSIGKTFHCFAFVQCFVSAFHIGIWVYLLRKICPDMIFSALYLYYIFYFFDFNMLGMREAVAVSFFLLSLYSLHNNNRMKMLIYIVIAMLFHIYAIFVFMMYWSAYEFVAGKKMIAMFAGLLLILFMIRYSDVIMDYYFYTVVESYLNNDYYGSTTLNIHGIIYLLGQLVSSFVLLLLLRRTYYEKYINLERKIFVIAIMLAVFIFAGRLKIYILYRLSNYFCFFIIILFVLACRQFLLRRKTLPRMMVYLFFLLVCPTLWAMHRLLDIHALDPTEKAYVDFYPYSSVFDKTLDKHREHVYNYRYESVFQ